MWLNLHLVPIAIRVCLVVLFPFSALDKIVFRKDAIAQADSSFLPETSGLLLVTFTTQLALLGVSARPPVPHHRRRYPAGTAMAIEPDNTPPRFEYWHAA